MLQQRTIPSVSDIGTVPDESSGIRVCSSGGLHQIVNDFTAQCARVDEILVQYQSLLIKDGFVHRDTLAALHGHDTNISLYASNFYGNFTEVISSKISNLRGVLNRIGASGDLITTINLGHCRGYTWNGSIAFRSQFSEYLPIKYENLYLGIATWETPPFFSLRYKQQDIELSAGQAYGMYALMRGKLYGKTALHKDLSTDSWFTIEHRIRPTIKELRALLPKDYVITTQTGRGYILERR